MITIIGAVLGLFSSALPDLIGLFKQKADNLQELKVLELQLRRDEKNAQYKMEEISVEADIREVEAIHREFAQRKVSYKWVEALISSVRPLITYAFFGMYATVKIMQVKLAMRALDGDLLLSLPTVWQDPDQALFATIIAFWFGGRMFQKYRKGQ